MPHLSDAATARYPRGIQGGDELVRQARAALTGEQRTVFDAAHPVNDMPVR